jgi:hypothetical protein
VEHQREFSFIVNTFLRMDDAAAAPHLAIIVRAINTLLITRRGDVNMIRFPPNGIVYRGSGLPDQHRSFFQSGRKYRVPGFLATSFSRNVAERFMMWADRRGEPCVLWIIHVDPAGEHSEARRCMHVNFVTRSHVDREDEYLFVPYAPFQVKQVSSVHAHDACIYVCMMSEVFTRICMLYDLRVYACMYIRTYMAAVSYSIYNRSTATWKIIGTHFKVFQ